MVCEYTRSIRPVARQQCRIAQSAYWVYYNRN